MNVELEEVAPAPVPLGDPVLEIKDLSVGYGYDADPVRVLRGVSLTLHRGEVLGLERRTEVALHAVRAGHDDHHVGRVGRADLGDVDREVLVVDAPLRVGMGLHASTRRSRRGDAGHHDAGGAVLRRPAAASRRSGRQAGRRH